MAIYQEAFPASEQKTPATLRTMLASPQYGFILLRLDEHVAAFAIVFLSKDSTFAMLEYFAVRQGIRAQGLGHRLFRDTVDLLEQREASFPLLIEVKAEGMPDAEYDSRLRRQQFYRRLGCRRIEGLNYILPLDHDPPPPPMEMMIRSGGRKLSRALLERWLRTIYTEVYGQAENDPRIAKMLDALPEEIPLDSSVD